MDEFQFVYKTSKLFYKKEKNETLCFIRFTQCPKANILFPAKNPLDRPETPCSSSPFYLIAYSSFEYINSDITFPYRGSRDIFNLGTNSAASSLSF